MRRRLVTVGVCCAALAATAPVPTAIAQDASSSAPGQNRVKSGASDTSRASTTAPGGSSAIPAGTVPPTGASASAPASTAAPAPPATTAAPASTTAAPASTTAPGGVSGQTPGSTADDSNTAVILLALAGAVLLLAAVAWGAARWWAWEPLWWIRWRHATAEAGWRTSAVWAEFRDWLRLGR